MSDSLFDDPSKREWNDAYDEAVQGRDWQTCDQLLEERELADWYRGPKHDARWWRWFRRLLRVAPREANTDGACLLSARSQKLLGDLLAARRKELGYSLAATVKRCERPPSVAYLQKLEQGKVDSPSPHVLHELAHALTIPYPTLMEAAGYIFPCGDVPEKPGALVSALLQAEDLSPQERASLEAYLAAVARSWRDHLRGD